MFLSWLGRRNGRRYLGETRGICLGNGANLLYTAEDSDRTAVEAAADPNQLPTEGADMAKPQSSKSPAFQFYPKEFLSSSKVIAMSATERGAYITLLSVQWLDGSLPNDLAALARLSGVAPKPFARMWPHNLARCFALKGGRFVNERLELERKKQAEYRRRQTDNAAKGWDRRRNATALPSQSQNDALLLRTAISDLQPVGKTYSGPLDVAFATFRDAYPEGRRKGGRLTQDAYITQVGRAGSPDALMAALVNHNASEQWLNPKLVPGMDVWLNEERWRQTLPAASGAPVGKRPFGSWRPAEAK